MHIAFASGTGSEIRRLHRQSIVETAHSRLDHAVHTAGRSVMIEMPMERVRRKRAYNGITVADVIDPLHVAKAVVSATIERRPRSPR